MTTVTFHVLQSAQPRARLHYLIQLLDRLISEGHRCDLRLRDAQAVQLLDRQLWRHPPESFLPHAPGTEAPSAPIRLWADPDTPSQGALLINLHADLFPAFQGYDQVIELLDQDPTRLEAGRTRYRQYRQHYGIVPAYQKVPQQP